MPNFSSCPCPCLSQIALCLLIYSSGMSHAAPLPPAKHVSEPAELGRNTSGGLTPTCIGGVFPQAQEPDLPPPRQAQCGGVWDVLFDGNFFNYRRNTIDRVTITGHATRPFEHNVCVGPNCYTELAGLGAAAAGAAALLGGWKTEIAAIVAPRLQKCARLPSASRVTLDVDSQNEYLFAIDAVKISYAGTYASLSTLNRVDVYYPSTGDAFTFFLDKANSGSEPFRLSSPSPADKGGPCQ